MADITPIKISELDAIRPQDISRDDEYMLNEGDTFKISLGAAIDFNLDKDLNFEGNVTFKGSIEPPSGEELNGVFNQVTVREELDLRSTTDVEGFYLNKHASDVNPTPQDGDILVWNAQDSEWVASTLSLMKDAPKDDRCYVRRGKQWALATTCNFNPPGASGPGASGPGASGPGASSPSFYL